MCGRESSHNVRCTLWMSAHTIPPINPNGFRGATYSWELVPAFNDRVRALATSENVTLVDVYQGFNNDFSLLGIDGLQCRPCSSHGPPACPLGHHRCMRELTVAAVLAAIEETGALRRRR